MEDSLRKDLKYLGLKSQKELLDIIGKKLIQRKIIEKIIEAGVHSISADEVTICNDVILSLCLRYVNNDNEICEVFTEFVELERITGEAIGNAIIKFYSDIGVEIAESRGQCYEGAANMQSQKKGASSYFLKESPKAIVTHCCSHNLNLSLASSCKHSGIDNIWKTYKAITIFLTAVQNGRIYQSTLSNPAVLVLKNKVLVGICKTRWSERGVSYEHFYRGIFFMVEAFKIMNGTYPKNNDFDSAYKDGWNSKTKEDATSYLNAITEFEFLIGLVSRYRLF